MIGTGSKFALKMCSALSVAAVCVAAVTVPPSLAQTFHLQRGYISTSPDPVRLAGQEVFTVTADAGEFTAQERTIIVERNLNNALISAKDRSPAAVEIITINKLPVLRVGGKHVVTIDTRLAAQHGMTCQALADLWANNMRTVLSNGVAVTNYISQLGGDFLVSPYAPPYRRAQWEAARANHAAKEASKGLPLNFVCSDSMETTGFDCLLKRDPIAAEANFRKSLQMEPNNERAHYGLGVALLKQGRVNESIGELEMARWLDHDDAQVHIALGEALESKGLDTEAYKRFREASLLQPENPEPYLAIADLREERNDIGKSVRELSDAMINNVPESQYVRLRHKDQYTWRLIRPY
jgi:tetratricopeptide (TPR) repeat protein